MEVRIEITTFNRSFLSEPVTSLVEVRIEINTKLHNLFQFASLPLWKCGLKYKGERVLTAEENVTSLVEVRIEISKL